MVSAAKTPSFLPPWPLILRGSDFTVPAFIPSSTPSSLPGPELMPPIPHPLSWVAKTSMSIMGSLFQRVVTSTCSSDRRANIFYVQTITPFTQTQRQSLLSSWGFAHKVDITTLTATDLLGPLRELVKATG